MNVLAADDKKSTSRPDKPVRNAGTRNTQGARAAVRDANVGGALRSVYEETVNEDIPPEFLDLLRKLT